MASVHSIHLRLRHALLACAALSLVSQIGAAQTSEPDPAAQPIMGSSNSRGRDTQHHEAGSAEATVSSLRDKLFLRQATVSSMSEVQLGELALQKSSDEEVRRLVSSLLVEHAKVLDGLKAAAEAQGVMLPTRLPAREQALYERLKRLRSEDFDREYIKRQMEDQHRDLRDFRAEAATTQDATLRTFAQDAASSLHQKIVLTNQIARAKGVSTSSSARDVTPSVPQ